MNAIQKSIILFQNARPGSIDRIKALISINADEIIEENENDVADVLMQIRYSNNGVDHEIIEDALASKHLDDEVEIVVLYGSNPWDTTNDLLNSSIRKILKRRAREEHNDD